MHSICNRYSNMSGDSKIFAAAAITRLFNVPAPDVHIYMYEHNYSIEFTVRTQANQLNCNLCRHVHNPHLYTIICNTAVPTMQFR